MPEYILGIDLGTTALKGALFDVQHGLVAVASADYPIYRPHPGHVEQRAEEWVEALLAVTDRLFDGRALDDLAAIGICSQVNTHVFVDGNGQALAPAIVWQDDRCESAAQALNARITAEQREQWWQSSGGVAASHTVARATWFAEHEPDLWRQTAQVLSPKDYLIRQLTGQYVTDPFSCFDLVDGTGAYIEGLIALVPGLRERLPPLQRYSHVVGPATHDRFAPSKAQVVNGTMDGFGCLFGSGAHRSGEGAYISGTSEIIALISDRPGGAPGIVSFMPVDGWHVQAGPTQSGGDTLRWMGNLLGETIEEVLVLAEQADRRNSPVFFLPHLQGERAPFWDSAARGTFLGLTSKHGKPEMALAALEGVAISARLVFEAAQQATGQLYDSLYLGGNGNRSDLWAQIRADVLGIPLKRVKCLDIGPVGAVIMAGVGTGMLASVQDASERFVEVERIFTPDPAMRDRYDAMTARYLAAYEALKPIYAA
jgi:xylulokinase